MRRGLGLFADPAQLDLICGVASDECASNIQDLAACPPSHMQVSPGQENPHQYFQICTQLLLCIAVSSPRAVGLLDI